MSLAAFAVLIAGARPGTAPADAPARAIEVVASRFRFEPSVIEVAEGERVALRLRSADTVHGLEIKALKKSVVIPKDGSVVVLEIVANKAGRFAFACSEYCGNGHGRMKGVLVVVPRPQ